MFTDREPAYKALSVLAVLSFILGLLSVLSLAHWLFQWTFPVAALTTALLALRQLRATPTEWTGKRFAQAGIGLAAACWLTASGIDLYGTVWIKRHGRAAADRFLETLKTGDVDGAFQLTLPWGSPSALQKLDINTMPPDMAVTYAAFCRKTEPLAQRLATGDCSIEFNCVEDTARDQDGDCALVVYNLHSSKGQTRVLVVASTVRSPTTPEIWYIRELKLDYVPHSHRIEPVGDYGHLSWRR